MIMLIVVGWILLGMMGGCLHAIAKSIESTRFGPPKSFLWEQVTVEDALRVSLWTFAGPFALALGLMSVLFELSFESKGWKPKVLWKWKQ